MTILVGEQSGGMLSNSFGEEPAIGELSSRIIISPVN
jgi:hypothetical protein